ncbi:MAG: hypothetical protein IKL97_03765 [Eggerthellaceae bacterium]|nr:hypothetical protein [Eggerthellaceae bacterium]
MGQRFQAYVNYGKTNEPGSPGDNLFAMHLQWCWGHFAIIRAHQLIDFLNGTRDQMFNPFGLGEHSRVGGMSFDGRREDLYLLRALTEINTVSSSIVPGHDLMVEENDFHKWEYEEGKLKNFPDTIKMDPLVQDNNDGFLVIQATEKEIKYAFCKDVSEIEPVSASEYLREYRSEMSEFDAKERVTIETMVESIEQHPLLTKTEMEQIFDREYDKKLNIEGYKEPERKLSRSESLSEVVKEAKDRAKQQQPSIDQNQKTDKRRDAPLL